MYVYAIFKSARNESDLRRYALAVAFNKRRNDPVKRHHHPQYHPLGIVPNSAVADCEAFDSTEEKGFMRPESDRTLTSLKKRMD